MLFALDGLFDEQACYDFLLKALYPNGLHCPNGHVLPFDQAPHDRHRAPVFDYRCRVCGRVFNLYSGTIWQKTRYRPSVIVQILYGLSQGTPTQHLAAELKIDRGHLLTRRHKIQGFIQAAFPPSKE